MLFSLAFAMVAASAPSPRLSTLTYDLPLPGTPGQHVTLHCVEPVHANGKSVLFIHGSSFATQLAAGFEFTPGDSWMTFMARRGYLACGLDFLGFGASSQPLAMQQDASRSAPVLRAPEAAAELALAVDRLRRYPGITAVHLVAHSWGTIPAATYAADHPGALTSLTLFGPVVPVASSGGPQDNRGAWFHLTAKERLEQLRFRQVLPSGMSLLDPALERRWAAEFAASVPHVQGDLPDDLRIPEGPNVDVDEARAGRYPYDPKNIAIPVLVVYGNYDVVVDDAGATALLARFTASPLKWQLRLDDGTHVMHLEKNRQSLYQGVNAFIQATEEALP